MALHLVGETIDRVSAHAAAEVGQLIGVYRSIYVDASDDINRTIIDHAVRIAAFLYPNAYLSGYSAANLAPTVDGRLFLTGRRNQRTRIRALEIIQNEAPQKPSTVPVMVGDDMGEIHLKASSPRQRFLEAFRQRSEHAGAIDPGLRKQMADRLIQEFGSRDRAADALWTIGRANKWVREAEAAEHYLLNNVQAAAPVNQARLDLVVAWHGEIVGNLVHDGAEWRWKAADNEQLVLIRETRPGSLPPFIESLLPEGWLAQVLNDRDERETLRSGSRYMSNVIIVQDPNEIATLPVDVIDGRLAVFQKHGLFTGRYGGPTKQNIEQSFQEKLAELFARSDTPRLSGVQIKAPMNLDRKGDLTPAVNMPFTHILKPAGTSGFENLPLVEWICLSLAQAAQFIVPEFALIDMPDGMAPALLVERFDIRRTRDDAHRIAMEDFCSVLDLPPSRKYDSTIERAARGLRPLSTDPDADVELLFRRAVFAWLIADGDMHLKNVALLKVADAEAARFDSVRLAPVYDVVTTRVFPNLEHDRMALKLAGKDSRLDPEAFKTLAQTIELSASRASVAMASCARQLFDAVTVLALPSKYAGTGEPMLDRIRKIVLERTEPFL
ncbi:HipA domain-containing protein [Methylobacterium sp. WL9]|uniref:type II toxin-antitoxin system HipA family toxin n=1 Tax=Methylobacterium sp. WL9 TaxID=2603898 RepID=UPI0011CAF2B8|nr:HipA domain-containing protein [Methylobacterium sp. WL9]TXN25133.1 HipA domain-containing protein [Methylobacterium sp. WL9]